MKDLPNDSVKPNGKLYPKKYHSIIMISSSKSSNYSGGGNVSNFSGSGGCDKSNFGGDTRDFGGSSSGEMSNFSGSGDDQSDFGSSSGGMGNLSGVSSTSTFHIRVAYSSLPSLTASSLFFFLLRSI